MGKHAQIIDLNYTPYRIAPGQFILLSSQVGGGYGAAPTSSNVSNSQNMARYVPFYFAQPTMIDALACHCVALNAGAGAVVRMGFHDDNGSGRPGDVIVDGGTAPITSTGIKTVEFTEVELEGFVWGVMATQGLDLAGANPTFSMTGLGASGASIPTPQASNNMHPNLNATVVGALADDPTLNIQYNTSAIVPHLYARVA